MEIWDAYKRDGTLAGCDLIRGREIPKGLYHLASEVIVKHKDGTYLLTQRDFNKDDCPGLYEASTRGSALKDENAYEAAIRELKEETGIKAENLKQIYKKINSNTIFYGFLCETDCCKDSIVLQEGETISYRWMRKDEFLEFVDSDKYVQSYKERMKEYFDSIS